MKNLINKNRLFRPNTDEEKALLEEYRKEKKKLIDNLDEGLKDINEVNKKFLIPDGSNKFNLSSIDELKKYGWKIADNLLNTKSNGFTEKDDLAKKLLKKGSIYRIDGFDYLITQAIYTSGYFPYDKWMYVGKPSDSWNYPTYNAEMDNREYLKINTPYSLFTSNFIPADERIRISNKMGYEEGVFLNVRQFNFSMVSFYSKPSDETWNEVIEKEELRHRYVNQPYSEISTEYYTDGDGAVEEWGIEYSELIELWSETYAYLDNEPPNNLESKYLREDSFAEKINFDNSILSFFSPENYVRSVPESFIEYLDQSKGIIEGLDKKELINRFEKVVDEDSTSSTTSLILNKGGNVGNLISGKQLQKDLQLLDEKIKMTDEEYAKQKDELIEKLPFGLTNYMSVNYKLLIPDGVNSRQYETIEDYKQMGWKLIDDWKSLTSLLPETGINIKAKELFDVGSVYGINGYDYLILDKTERAGFFPYDKYMYVGEPPDEEELKIANEGNKYYNENLFISSFVQPYPTYDRTKNLHLNIRRKEVTHFTYIMKPSDKTWNEVIKEGGLQTNTFKQPYRTLITEPLPFEPSVNYQKRGIRSEDYEYWRKYLEEDIFSKYSENDSSIKNFYKENDILHLNINLDNPMWEFFTPERLVKKLNPNFVDYLKQEIERQYLIKNKKINSSEKNETVIDEFGRISLRYNQGGELLIAPNGKPSNLTPEQYELVRTPAFKNWFGDWENNPKEASKVIDENGEPKVVNHTTKMLSDEYGNYIDKMPIDIFESNYEFSTKNTTVYPIWFSYEGVYLDSSIYTEMINVDFFLNIRNLFDFKNKMQVDSLKEYANENYDWASGIEDIDFTYISYEDIEAYHIPAIIKEMGYDGYLALTNNENAIVTFESLQSKLADGSNKTFDPNNPDIRFDGGGLIAPNGKSSKLTPEQYELVRTPAFKNWFGDWENNPKGASKVIDENGEPLVVYHGSPVGETTEFALYRQGKESSGLKEYGMYFTTNKNTPLVYKRSGREMTQSYKDKLLEVENKLNNTRNNYDYERLSQYIQDLKYGRIFEVFLNIRDIRVFDAKGEIGVRAYDNVIVDAGYKKAINRDAMHFLKEGFRQRNNDNPDDDTIIEKVDGIQINNVADISDGINWSERFDTKEDYMGTSYVVFPNKGNLFSNIKLADGSNTTFDNENTDIRFDYGGIIEQLGNNPDRLYDINIFKNLDVNEDNWKAKLLDSALESTMKKLNLYNQTKILKPYNIKGQIETLKNDLFIINNDTFYLPQYPKDNQTITLEGKEKTDFLKQMLIGDDEFKFVLLWIMQYSNYPNSFEQWVNDLSEKIQSVDINKGNPNFLFKYSFRIIFADNDLLPDINTWGQKADVVYTFNQMWIDSLMQRDFYPYRLIAVNSRSLSIGIPNTFDNAIDILEDSIEKDFDKLYSVSKEQEIKSLTIWDNKFIDFLKSLVQDCREMGIIYDPNAFNFGTIDSNWVLYDIENFIPTIEIKDKYDNYEVSPYEDLSMNPDLKLISQGIGSGGAVYKDKKRNTIIKLTTSPMEVWGCLLIKEKQDKGTISDNFVPIYSIKKLGEGLQPDALLSENNNFWVIEKEYVYLNENDNDFRINQILNQIMEYYKPKAQALDELRSGFDSEQEFYDEVKELKLAEGYYLLPKEDGINYNENGEAVLDYGGIRNTKAGIISLQNPLTPFINTPIGNNYITYYDERLFDKDLIFRSFEDYDLGGQINTKNKYIYVSIRLNYELGEKYKNKYGGIGRIKNFNRKVFEELKDKKLVGIKGVSKSVENIADWFIFRDCLVVMDYEQFMKINDTTEIQYNSPEQLMSNDLELFNRLYANERDLKNEYKTKSQRRENLGKIIRFLPFEFKIAGKIQTDNQLKNELYRMEYFTNPNETSAFQSWLDTNEYIINSPKELAELIITYHYSDDSKSKIGSFYGNTENLNITLDDIYPFVYKAIVKAGKTYADEQEVIINDMKMNIPNSSKLFFKEQLTDNSNLNQLIDEYQLNNLYTVEFVEQKEVDDYRGIIDKKRGEDFENMLQSGKDNLEIKKSEVLQVIKSEIIDAFNSFYLNKIKSEINDGRYYKEYEGDDTVFYNLIEVPEIQQIIKDTNEIISNTFDETFDKENVEYTDKYLFTSFLYKLEDRISEYIRDNESRVVEEIDMYRNENSDYINSYTIMSLRDAFENLPQLGGIYLRDKYVQLMEGDMFRYYPEKDLKLFKKGGKTVSQTPAPKKDQVKGSAKNKKGSSKDIKSAKKIKLADKTITTIKNKINEHNEKYPKKKINLPSAKAVVRRGMGAYSSSYRPTIKGGKPNSRVAWGIARLNAFIYKIVNGKSKSGKYSQDNDLIKELGIKVQKMDDGGIINYADVEEKLYNAKNEKNTDKMYSLIFKRAYFEKFKSTNMGIFNDMDFYPFLDRPYPDINETIREIYRLKQLPYDIKLIEEGNDLSRYFNSFLESKDIIVSEDNSKELRTLRKGVDSFIILIKKYYDRPRPKQVADANGIPLKVFYLSSAQTPSYPSGHSLQGMFMALFYANLYPEYTNEFIQIAKNISLSRLVARVHYPSDTNFGEEIGKEMFDFYLKSKR